MVSACYAYVIQVTDLRSKLLIAVDQSQVQEIMRLFDANVSPLGTTANHAAPPLLTSAGLAKKDGKIHRDQYLMSFDRLAHFATESGLIPRGNVATIIQQAYPDQDEQNITRVVDKVCSGDFAHAGNFLMIVVNSGFLE